MAEFAQDFVEALGHEQEKLIKLLVKVQDPFVKDLPEGDNLTDRERALVDLASTVGAVAAVNLVSQGAYAAALRGMLDDLAEQEVEPEVEPEGTGQYL